MLMYVNMKGILTWSIEKTSDNPTVQWVHFRFGSWMFDVEKCSAIEEPIDSRLQSAALGS
jgi:hypothetical protein